MNVAAIPTEHNGCVYRSRLEATWANFFDLAKWQYQYEPFDLNGWIPDFVLLVKKHQTLVEVKPYCTLEEFFVNGVVDKINKAMEGDKREVLLLGCTIIECSFGAAIGWLSDRVWWQEETLAITQPAAAALDNNGFFSDIDSFMNRITGEYDGAHHLEPISLQDGKKVFNLAQNNARWQPGKSYTK
jgi:hypothetical protein